MLPLCMITVLSVITNCGLQTQARLVPQMLGAENNVSLNQSCSNDDTSEIARVLVLVICDQFKMEVSCSAAFESFCSSHNSTFNNFLHPKHTQLKEARHPCVELQDDMNFIGNDFNLVFGSSSFLLVMGTNMGLVILFCI